MMTRSSRRQTTGARAAIRVLVALLSLFSLLAFLAPLSASSLVVAAAAACDASERPTVHDRQIEPLRVPMARPSRVANEAAPGVRDPSAFTPVRSACVTPRPPILAAAIDPSIPSARARAERMVFLI